MITITPDCPLNEVRLIIGDADSELLADPVIDALLTTFDDDVNKTALQCIKYIIAQAAKLKDEETDEVAVRWSQIYDHYNELYSRLKAELGSMSAANGAFFIGGTLVDETNNQLSHSNTVKNPIRKGPSILNTNTSSNHPNDPYQLV